MTIPIRLGRWQCPFAVWRVALGRVFTRPFALDLETAAIDPDRFWEAPPCVLAAACDGTAGYFVPPDRLAPFWETHAGVPLVFHHAPFDLKVLHGLEPKLNVYDRVEQSLVWDTLLLHRLHALAKDGHTAFGKASLEHCVQAYLGCELPKSIRDADGHDVRTSYGRYLGRDPREIPQTYLEYLGKDALATIRLYDELTARIRRLLDNTAQAWGYVSPEWLGEQIGRWGPLTHHIQLKAAVVLDAITANGIGLDVASRDTLLGELEAVAAEKATALHARGYTPGQGSGGKLQSIMQETLQADPSLRVPRTKSGKYKTDEAALADLATVDPFFRDLLDHRTAEKLRTTYVAKMGRGRLHPKFDVLKNTGRTSSHGEINAQNLPRDDRVRRCFVPADGCYFLDADYATIEMATLAQSVLSQFGGASCMAQAINAGKDLHRLVAAYVTGKGEADVTRDERAKAKPINFGKPGGMGQATLRQYAQASYGIMLTDNEVATLEDAWFALFPEMDEFLADETDDAFELAALLDLTPADYDHAQGRPARTGGDADEPAGWLGGMCLKVLRDDRPTTGQGRPYSEEELAYFWDRLQELSPHLKAEHVHAVENRKPIPALASAVRNLVSRSGVFTLTGRLRAGATYCARHNTVFQGLAADGAKLALWALWRRGYRLVNFIHDQVLIEVEATADLAAVAADVQAVMVESMRAVVPDVAVKVEWAYRKRWSKHRDDQVPVPSAAAA